MLEGLMQHDYQLSIGSMLRRMRTVNAASEVATLRDPGEIDRASYAQVAERADRLAGACALSASTRAIASRRSCGTRRSITRPTWESLRGRRSAHPEPPSLPRAAHLHRQPCPRTGSSFFDDSLVALLASVAGTFECVEHYIVVGEGDASALPRRPASTRSCSPPRRAGSTAPRSTTALPPRSATPAARRATRRASCTPIARPICTRWRRRCPTRLTSRPRDKILPVVPMFHANAWGLPYAAALSGADLVLPSKYLQAGSDRRAHREASVRPSLARTHDLERRAALRLTSTSRTSRR